jgi:tetraacyldisaccharide 4'-kinase
MLKVRQWYLNVISKEKRTLLEGGVYLVLVLLSYLWAAVVGIKNFLYNSRLLRPASVSKKVISVGNLSWGGTGKTSLVIYLYKKLHMTNRVCAITKGYAPDEYSLLKEEVGHVFDARDRVTLIENLTARYDLFIVDDGFQYRTIYRDLDIVLLNKEDVGDKMFLIPASNFREPLRSVNRADIVMITYCSPQDGELVKKKLLEIKQDLKIFFADYVCESIVDREKKNVSCAYFGDKKVGILTAIGYPEGFLNKVKESGITPSKVVIYPDHYHIEQKTLEEIEANFVKEGITDILITYKDFYHIDFRGATLHYFIFRVTLNIHQEEQFLAEVHNVLADKSGE